MKVLVTGASGLLGKKVISVLSDEHAVGGVHLNVEVPNSKPLDITNQIEVANFIKLYTPEVIVHTAAISDANYCEENQEIAWSVNVEGTRNLVMAAKLGNAKFIYISSDYVFDGENDSYDISAKPNPIGSKIGSILNRAPRRTNTSMVLSSEVRSRGLSGMTTNSTSS